MTWNFTYKTIGNMKIVNKKDGGVTIYIYI
jgi:hypothetical protein